MEKIISLKNKKVYYNVYGNGSIVVLIHGFAEDNTIWKYQVDELSKQYQLIIPDLPGSGKSEITDDMSIEGMAGCIKQIIDKEISQNKNLSVTMIGHSMGGYIALAFAEKYAAMLRGIGLFHSTAYADTVEKKAIRRRGITFINTHGSAAFIRQSAPNLFTENYRIKNNTILEEMIDRYGSFDPLVLTAYYEAMILRPDRTTVLQSINKPVLFIIGKNDKSISFEDSLKQSHMPQMAFIEILENAAHMGIWEEKEKSNQVLQSFLQETA